jgi:hypothetical protein
LVLKDGDDDSMMSGKDDVDMRCSCSTMKSSGGRLGMEEVDIRCSCMVNMSMGHGEAEDEPCIDAIKQS